MTIHDISSQLIDLAVANYINGERFTATRLENTIRAWFKGSPKNRVVMEISLPDGRWLFAITQYRPGEFDYWIPDTREQEAKLKAELLA